MLFKKLILVSIVVSLVYYLTNFNSGEVIYTVTLNKSKIENNLKQNPNSNASKTIKSLLQNSSDVEFKLMFTSNESIYEFINSMDNEAVKGINLTKIFAGNNSQFYYNKTNQECLSKTVISDEAFLIIREPLKWKLTTKTKIIDKYKCFEAKYLNISGSETDITAWYTPEIPLPFGPERFNGLPGLILELENKTVSFSASKIKLDEKIIKIKRPNDGILITYEEFKNRFRGIFDEE